MTYPHIPVRRVFRVANGGTPTSDPANWDGDIPWATPADLTDTFAAISETSRYITQKGVKSGSYVAPKSSIIISTRAPIGKVAITQREMAFNQGCRALIPHQGSDMRYFGYQFEGLKKQLNSRGSGTTFTELSSEGLASIKVWVPPLEEQRRIADFLDAETSRINNLISVKQKVVTLLDERRESLTSQLCLRGPWRASSTRDSGISPIGAIPDHWIVTRNKNFIREVVELSETGDEELLTVSHITGVTPRSEKVVNMFMAESRVGYKICRPGDLVINTLWAWMGALGVANNYGIVSPAYGVYRFTSDGVEPRYFDYLYRTREYICEMTRHSKGVWTSRLRLYPESFLALKCPVPPKVEQVEITRTLDRELESDQRLRSTIQRSCELLAERRQALITAAVTGQFDVSTASGRGIED